MRDRALALIDAGADVARFAEGGSHVVRKRQKALHALADQLRWPQPLPKRMNRPKPHQSQLNGGDVVRIRGSKTDKEGLFAVIDLAEGYPRGSTEPVLAGLLWRGGPVPSAAEMVHVPLVVEAAAPDPSVPGFDTRGYVAVHVVLAPTRGPRAFGNFGDVVDRGLHRPDAPDHRTAPRPGISLAYCDWAYLSGSLDSGWYDQCLDETSRLAALDPRRGA